MSLIPSPTHDPSPTHLHAARKADPPSSHRGPDAVTRRRLWLLCVGLAGAFPVGCGDAQRSSDSADASSDGDAADGDIGGEATGMCQRDPELIAERLPCLVDDRCPCGTHCDFGLCMAECLSISDCEPGEICDDFGRCGPPRPGRIAPLDRDPRGRLQVPPPELYIGSRGAPVSLRLYPRGPVPGQVRAVASGDIALRCNDGEFATECRFAAVPPEGVRLEVKATGDVRQVPDTAGLTAEAAAIAQKSLGRVTVFDASGNRHETLVVRPRAQTRGEFTAGRYEGLLWLGPADSDEALRSPVVVNVYGQPPNARIEVIDVFGVYFKAPIVMALVEDGEGFGARLPARTLWERSTASGDSAAVFFEASPSRSGRVEGPLVEFVFPIALTGVGADPSAPHELVISATLSPDEAPSTAPALSLDEAAPVITSASVAVETLRTYANAGSPMSSLADLTPFLESDDGVSPVACFADETERAEALNAASIRLSQACNRALTIASIRRDLLGTPVHVCPTIDDPDPSYTFPCEWLRRGDSPEFFEGNCATVAAEFGCEISAAPPLPGGLGVIKYDPIRQCTMPRVATPGREECVAAVLCAESAAPTRPAGFADALSSASGDPRCLSGRPLQVFGALERPEPATADTDTAMTELFEACLTELGRVRADGDIGRIFGDNACLGSERLLLALEVALGLHAPDEPMSEASERLAARLLSMLLDAHGIVTHIALATFREQLVLAAVNDPDSDAIGALRVAAGVWPLVLEHAEAIANLSAASLASPDPRPDLGFSPVVIEVAGGNASVGLPVTLFDTLSAQLEFADTLLERAWMSGVAGLIDDREALAVELLEVAVSVRTLAGELHSSADGEEGALLWQAAWERASLVLDQRLETLTRRLGLIADNANPLGLEESDLPLYFRGDPLVPSERFSAVTRYLVGDGAGSDAIAPAAVAAAKAAFDEVRDLWRERISAEDLATRRIQDIKLRYGELITGYCGASIDGETNYANADQPACINPGSLSVFDCPEIDTEVCFLESRCRPRRERFLEDLTTAELGYQLCLAGRFEELLGTRLTPLDFIDTSAFGGIIEAIVADQWTEEFPFVIESLAIEGANVRVAYLRYTDADGLSQQRRLELDALGELGAVSSLDAPMSDILLIRADCNARREDTEALRPEAKPVTCVLADQCPSAHACRDGVCVSTLASDLLDEVDCYYDGAISEQAIAVRSAATDIAIARQEFNDFIGSYEIAVESCLILQRGNAGIEELTAQHNKIMDRLDRAKGAMEGLAAEAAAVKDCGSSWDLGDFGTAVACGGAAAEAQFTVAAIALETEMNIAEREYQEELLAKQNGIAERTCMNDAGLALVGAKAAQMRVLRSRQDQAKAILNLRGQKSYTLALFNEGRAAVALEEARRERSLPSRFVTSEAAERFAAKQRYAQRVTYLAVRAVEYEFQQSLAQLQDVLAATSPLQLEAVLDEVSRYVATGRIGGNAPDALHVVVSLRDELLQLRELSSDPDNLLGLTPSERFRSLLQRENHRVYGADGTLLGYQIPFGIHPLGSDSPGVAVFTQGDCAERLWSVNAAIVGTDVYSTNASSLTRVDLLKRNTFYSQWCDSRGGGEPFQVASVRPSVNLLLDPADPNRATPLDPEETGFSRGRMQPYLNVTRAQLEAESYSQGGTQELAGRGLFGDYALFIPADILMSELRPGLDLNKVDDILLRIDYVSVAR